MNFKKNGSRIFGVVLNKKEEEALNREIQRQCEEFDRQHMTELDSVVLWILHERFGFGEARLKRFHDAFTDEIKNLSERYKTDNAWVCTAKLKEHGIDITEWNTE